MTDTVIGACIRCGVPVGEGKVWCESCHESCTGTDPGWTNVGTKRKVEGDEIPQRTEIEVECGDEHYTESVYYLTSEQGLLVPKDNAPDGVWLKFFADMFEHSDLELSGLNDVYEWACRRIGRESKEIG